jgi:hypothetical protein
MMNQPILPPGAGWRHPKDAMDPAAQFDPAPFSCRQVSTGFPYNDLPLRICIPDAQMGYRPHSAMDAGRLFLVG